MNKASPPAGTVHATLPRDLRTALAKSDTALKAWNDITPLARNEWICWVEGAKLIETRQRRVERTHTELSEGKRRPCCWPGCMHREKNGRA
ncbi:MAG: YdeI/OmpD-associated family protein [Patescibacteria group bacterium]